MANNSQKSYTEFKNSVSDMVRDVFLPEVFGMPLSVIDDILLGWTSKENKSQPDSYTDYKVYISMFNTLPDTMSINAPDDVIRTVARRLVSSVIFID